MATNWHAMIEELENDLVPVELTRAEIIAGINLARKKVGLPPRPDTPSGGGGGGVVTGSTPASGGNLTTIKSDAFVGKRLRSAAKEYLAMRKSQGLDGPASPREIYDAIMAGGFEFEAKDETNRLISLRTTLRKRTEVFRKIDSNGKYGLAEWYEHGKKPKAPAAASASDDDDEETETATTKKAAAAS